MYLVILDDGSTSYADTADQACARVTLEWAAPARTLRTLNPGDELTIGGASIIVLTGVDVSA